MRRARRWSQILLDLFVMEVRRPDGTTYVTSIEPMGFGECWAPIEITTTIPATTTTDSAEIALPA